MWVVGVAAGLGRFVFESGIAEEGARAVADGSADSNYVTGSNEPDNDLVVTKRFVVTDRAIEFAKRAVTVFVEAQGRSGVVAFRAVSRGFHKSSV